MKEIDKYQHLYAEQAEGRGYRRYGHSNHGKHLLPYFLSLDPESALDVGCGHNEWSKHLKERGIRAVGVDFACPGADIIAEAHALPFDHKEWDFVTAFDVLEHIPESLIDPVLREFARVGHRFAFSISYVDSVNRVKGETLHPCVQPKHWWLQKIAQYGHPREYKKYIVGEWK